jgi:hypothetical protein
MTGKMRRQIASYLTAIWTRDLPNIEWNAKHYTDYKQAHYIAKMQIKQLVLYKYIRPVLKLLNGYRSL